MQQCAIQRVYLHMCLQECEPWADWVTALLSVGVCCDDIRHCSVTQTYKYKQWAWGLQRHL
jgi:hypothetical protein